MLEKLNNLNLLNFKGYATTPQSVSSPIHDNQPRKFDSDFQVVIDTTLYDNAKGLPDYRGNYIYKVNNDIVVATKEGFYEYDKSQDKFVESLKYNKYFANHKYEINKIYADKYGNKWSFYKPSHKSEKYNLACLKSISDSVYVDLGNIFNPFICFISPYISTIISIYLSGNCK